jgi:hypothetical protein
MNNICGNNPSTKMEWEPITLANDGKVMPWVDKEKENKINTKRSTKSELVDAEHRMIQTLLPYDVLLVGKSSLQKLVKGNEFYNQQLKMFQQKYTTTTATTTTTFTNTIVESIMESIWSNDGRFLSYQDGIISILTIDRTKRCIKQDLMFQQQQQQQQQQPKRRSQKRHDNKSTHNGKHTQKDVSTKKKKQNMKERQRRRRQRRHETKFKRPSFPPQRILSFGQTTDGMMYGDV